MNAAQITEMNRHRGQHQITGMRICPGPKCWCGRCHCTRCQSKRAAASQPEFAIDPKRGPSAPGGAA